MADGVAVLDMGVIAQTGTPKGLYDRPGSRFVADFLGETNFVEGTAGAAAAGSTAGGISVNTPAGDLSSATVTSGTMPAPGQKVTCSIRPEAIRIDAEAGDRTTNTLEGTIVESVYLGEMAQHLIELRGGTRLKVFEMHPAGAGERAVGERVSLRVNAGDVVILGK